MLYLTVPPNEQRWKVMAEAGIGVMMTPKSGMRLERTLAYPLWAADNGCFSSKRAFDLSRYLNWLEAMAPAAQSCLFAPAPDVVGDAEATWERSREVLPILRDLGYRAALVAQDGIEKTDVEWDAFDVLFIGGSTAWKLSEAAFGMVQEAKERGKRVHMGRVNSRRRLLLAASVGCDSADGTMIAFGPDKRLPQLIRWLEELLGQPHLPFVATTESEAESA